MDTNQLSIKRTDEWINKITHTHTHSGILLSHKKEWNIAICNNINGPNLKTIIVSEVTQKEKNKYHDITYMESKKNDTSEIIYKTKVESQT